jgi:hypothetical protein
LLAEHYAMAIRRRDRELSHAPGLVLERLGGDDAPFSEFAIQVVDLFDGRIGKPGMVAGLPGRYFVRAPSINRNSSRDRKDQPSTSKSRVKPSFSR